MLHTLLFICVNQLRVRQRRQDDIKKEHMHVKVIRIKKSKAAVESKLIMHVAQPLHGQINKKLHWQEFYIKNYSLCIFIFCHQESLLRVSILTNQDTHNLQHAIYCFRKLHHLFCFMSSSELLKAEQLRSSGLLVSSIFTE